MRLANLDGRAVLLTDDTSGLDVHAASGGRFGPELPAIYDCWPQFAAWAGDWQPRGDTVTVDRSALGSPSPAPRQIVAIGLNYADHAKESGFGAPEGLPPVFTKFPSSLSGPDVEVTLPGGGYTDWEVELVAVIGTQASRVDEESAWGHVAGLSVGQDLSERLSQLAGPAPQFSLGKSFARFAPVGPWLVTPDTVPDRDDLRLGCRVGDEVVQDGRTSQLIYSVPQLVSRLSRTITLFPGDIIFTGTPAGVGMGRSPQRFLQPGETLTSWVEGIGEIQQTFVAERT